MSRTTAPDLPATGNRGFFCSMVVRRITPIDGPAGDGCICNREPGALAMGAKSGGRNLAYIGTHTNDPHEGIHVFELDGASGELKARGIVGEVGNPFFLALDPRREFLYAANAVDRVQGQDGGGVRVFRIQQDTGMLSPINQQPSQGATPCYVSVPRNRTCVLVANDNTGNVAALPIRPSGELAPASCTIQHEGSSKDPARQEGPHVHSIVLDPAERYAFAADLGTDQVRVYQLDAAAAQLTPSVEQPVVPIAPGSGPRHLVFDADARHAYLINELGNTLTVFDYDADRGMLTEKQTVSTLPPGFTGTSYCADVCLHPSGGFLYGTNRGHDSIAAYAVDPASGTLSLMEIVDSEGNFPWNLSIDPSGRFIVVCNQGEDDVAVFRMDPDSGRLRFTGHKVHVPKPVCVRMLDFKG